MRTFTTNDDRVEMFVPVMKFDQRTGEYEGWASLEEPDGHGEICDIEKSWPAIVSDAQSQKEISRGQSVGVLRRQHNRQTSIGKETLIELRDREGIKGIFVKGICTDEQAKSDAATGVLTGLSYRGLIQRWPDETVEGLTRFAWKSREETSFVDRPAVPHALIEVMKSDGGVEMVKARGYEPPQGFLCRGNTFHAKKDDARLCEEHEASKAECSCAVTHEGPCLPSRVEVEAQKISTATRDSLSDDNFALPGRKYPIDTKARARNALARVSQFGSPSQQKKVRSAVKKKYPDIDVGGDDSGKSEKPAMGVAAKSLYSASSILLMLDQLNSIISSEEYEETWESIQGEAGTAGVDAIAKLKEGAAVLFDAAEAIIEDERSEIDDDVYGEMAASHAHAMHFHGQLAQKQFLKSLRVPSGNGSISPTKAEDKSMDTEAMKSQIQTGITEALKAFVDPFAKALGLTMATPAVADVAEALKSRDLANAEAMKAATTKIDALETQFGSIHDLVVESNKALAQNLAMTHQVKVADASNLTEVLKAIEDKPAKPQGQMRTVPITKPQDDEAAKAKDGEEHVDPATLSVRDSRARVPIQMG